MWVVTLAIMLLGIYVRLLFQHRHRDSVLSGVGVVVGRLGLAVTPIYAR